MKRAAGVSHGTASAIEECSLTLMGAREVEVASWAAVIIHLHYFQTPLAQFHITLKMQGGVEVDLKLQGVNNVIKSLELLETWKNDNWNEQGMNNYSFGVIIDLKWHLLFKKWTYAF